MSKRYEYTEEMILQMHEVFSGGVTEEKIQSLVEEFDFPRRSVTAKARKEGFDVPTKPKAAPVFSADQTEALVSYLEANHGDLTAEEIATNFADGEFSSRQINGKVLSLEMTDAVKPAEKKEAVRTYTEEQEAIITKMTGNDAYIEEIAEAVGRPVQSVRGKLLSMGLKAPQRDKKDTKTDAYEGIEELAADKTVAELADHFGKTERGTKTVLSRRGLTAKDYTPKTKA